MATLREVTQVRLPMLLMNEHVSVHFMLPGEAALDIVVKQVGLDYIAGVTDVGSRRVLVPLTAILYLERLDP